MRHMQEGINEDSSGIYMLAANDMFRRLEAAQATEQGKGYFIAVSMFEIYGQKVRVVQKL